MSAGKAKKTERNDVNKEGFLIVEDDSARLLTLRILEDFSGLLVATNSGSFGDEDAPELLPETRSNASSGVYYMPLDTSNLIKSYRAARKHGMNMTRVHLGLADDVRQRTLCETYKKLCPIDRKRHKNCYKDFGIRELSDVCPAVHWPVLDVAPGGKINGVIFTQEFG
jgi:hypothetical protein